ncbi:MAG: YggS family pyridoxal phosphate-dependent enzyme [Tissierellia bacterium]|nr:YggS family pyridoxal phosphate-dependent enzyme [Tissierellia bacterium]MDD3226880.1 YggS family pyridoxal phosphate-dependent enzyme [Tissierellia bacterium]MDD3751085.1 YggS family pyridoxal phosphate-dependent enzyme [Tissierellia bacterium]MDD4045954.1 YggS family pyridoxal phosphate-dependent enzyme [Tissierellia bacterium]MDD4678055.1 YggS family pyridoxal phosphate-dependent enzyme [Tissierellia bacterium]
MSIRENIDDITKKIENTCKKIGRNPKDITVIAVSKTVESKRAKEAVNAGINNLGENRVQELIKKYDELSDLDVKWHMIGHLQKNKVKYIIDKTVLIHSVESLSLAEEINKRAEKNNLIANVLIELNIGEEESKFGINEENVYDFITSMEQFENIKVLGLMTVAPFCENPEDVRWVFKKMKNIYDKISTMNLRNTEMNYLSMGMTNDYEIAIEEGSNIIRIGTAIFGARNYKEEE